MGSAGGINYYGGKLDEVRVSSNVRSAGWIQTEYNNQSSPATFLSVASEQSNGNTVATPTFSVPGGTYSSAQSVRISTTTIGSLNSLHHQRHRAERNCGDICTAVRSRSAAARR